MAIRTFTHMHGEYTLVLEHLFIGFFSSLSVYLHHNIYIYIYKLYLYCFFYCLHSFWNATFNPNRCRDDAKKKNCQLSFLQLNRIYLFEGYLCITQKTQLQILMRMNTIFLQYFLKNRLPTANRILTRCNIYAGKDFVD